jgi:hypothetical protein
MDSQRDLETTALDRRPSEQLANLSEMAGYNTKVRRGVPTGRIAQ